MRCCASWWQCLGSGRVPSLDQDKARSAAIRCSWPRRSIIEGELRHRRIVRVLDLDRFAAVAKRGAVFELGLRDDDSPARYKPRPGREAELDPAGKTHAAQVERDGIARVHNLDKLLTTAFV